MSLKEDATRVAVLKALRAALSAPEPRSFSLRSLPGGTEEITRAWRRGALDLRRVITLDGSEP